MQYHLIESKVLEFKERLDEYTRFLETVIAFSNTQGGKIIIGIRSENRLIVGLSQEDLLKYNEEISQVLSSSIMPQIAVQLYEQDFDRKTCLVVQVFPGPEKPYFMKKMGFPSGVFFRYGSHNRVADSYALNQLEQLRTNKRFEETFCPQITYEDLSPELLALIFPGLDAQRLIGSALATYDTAGHIIPNVASVLLFYPNHHSIIAESTVVVSWYAGEDTRQLIKTMEFSGGLIPMIEQAYQYLLSILGSNYEMDGLVKKPTVYEIPPSALREALVNAVAHRSYDFEAPIRIQLFSNRIEFLNPGVFYAPINPDNLRQGLSRYRNPLIANALRKKGYMEKQGIGINHIIERCLEVGLGEPQFIELEHYLKVVISFAKHQISEAVGFTYDRQYFEARGEFTVREYAHYIGRSVSTAKKELYELRQQGEVEMIGKGPATVYRFITTN